MAVLDTYERKARLTPGLYAVLPIACTITTLGLNKFPLIAGLVGLLSAAGGAWLLSNLVGDLGRKAELVLFEKWCGSPTTKALRLREETDNPVQRDGWRSAVTDLTGTALMTGVEETKDPAAADHRITAASAQLLYLGQESGEPAVRNENVAYGYQRNLYGFRHIGRTIAVGSIAVQVIVVVGPWKTSTSACTIGIAVCAAFLALWMILPSQERTRLAADRYTRQLFIAARNRSR